MRPGAPPKSRRYVYTGPWEVPSLITDPPGLRWSPALIIYIYNEPPAKFYVCSDVPHAHTHTSTLATLTVLTRFYKTSKVSDASTEALQEQGHAARTRLVRCFGVLHIQSIHRKSSYIRTETLWSYPTCCRETSPKKTSCWLKPPTDHHCTSFGQQNWIKKNFRHQFQILPSFLISWWVKTCIKTRCSCRCV